MKEARLPEVGQRNAYCVLVAFAIIVGTADRVWACSCAEFSPCSLYSAADAVFLGEVVDARVEGRPLVAQLRVTRVWKGTLDPLVTVSNPANSSCSFAFAVGTRFVVYGGGTGSTFTTHVCAGGGQLRPGEPEPDLPRVGGSVTGQVARYKEVIVDRDDLSDPVVGIRVWVESRGRILETHSDTSGAFTLRGVAAGDHTIHADFGVEEILIKAIVSDVAFATVCGPPGVSLMTSTKGTIKRWSLTRASASSRTTMAANTSSTTLRARAGGSMNCAQASW